MANPFQFLQQVKNEAGKVVWPSRKETMVTTIMVFIMATLAAGFFFAIDQVFRSVVPLVTGLGG
jgi:preprotein translocase subunit SecE